MRKLSTKWFNKWAEKANLSNFTLLESIDNLEKGLSVVDLGGSLFKIRVKRADKGKSAGFRTIVAYKKEEKVVFLYGFGKNEKSNINKAELQYFKKLGKDMLALEDKQVLDFIEKHILFDLEVHK
ncbi:MAG: type II toxin-antitoxin system RelE/ParE family toxin [Deltaproteobacteria bacterium]|nr:type II toxin-antitoxin system RelE/ParE family toxin [Candidatus Tharpella aukensis]